jgi:hypothetical protein
MSPQEEGVMRRFVHTDRVLLFMCLWLTRLFLPGSWSSLVMVLVARLVCSVSLRLATFLQYVVSLSKIKHCHLTNHFNSDTYALDRHVRLGAAC